MGADFTRPLAAIRADLERHADAEFGAHPVGLAAVRRAVFMERGGHAPIDRCALTEKEENDER